MSSRLQLDVCNLSLWRRHLVNGYEVKAGIGVIAGSTVWSKPERLETEALHKVRYINTLTFPSLLPNMGRLGSGPSLVGRIGSGLQKSRPILSYENKKVKVKVSGFIWRLYCSTSHSRRSDTDRSFTCKLHCTCLYLVSVHQMAPSQTDVADI